MDATRLLSALGLRVRNLRNRHEYTLNELASRSGLSARFLIAVEAGQANISVRKLVGLAGALGTTPGVLLASPGAAPRRRPPGPARRREDDDRPAPGAPAARALRRAGPAGRAGRGDVAGRGLR